MNKVIIIGRLGQLPEVRTFEGGSRCGLSVATSEKWTDKDGQKQERTEWHRVVVFGKMAELCGTYLHKGSEVAIEGRIQTRSYDKDGEKRYSTEIIAQSVKFLGKPVEPRANEPTEPSFDDDSEIPF